MDKYSELKEKIKELSNKLDEVEHWLFCVSEGHAFVDLNMQEVLEKLNMEPLYPDWKEDENQKG